MSGGLLRGVGCLFPGLGHRVRGRDSGVCGY